jgi:O-glycosyl hydrolase
VFADPEAARYLSGVGIHWYGTASDISSRLNQTYHNHPDKFILATEVIGLEFIWVKKDGYYLGL